MSPDGTTYDALTTAIAVTIASVGRDGGWPGSRAAGWGSAQSTCQSALNSHEARIGVTLSYAGPVAAICVIAIRVCADCKMATKVNQGQTFQINQ